MKTEVIPAILVKTREDLLERIGRVSHAVSSVHIDVMDNKFVPNQTVGTNNFESLPKGIAYEFHWMVKDPEKEIVKIKGPHLHIVHVEAIGDWGAIKRAARDSGGKLGIALSPSTPIEKLEPYMEDISTVLVMSVEPGFDGQKYMVKVEEKVESLRRRYPKLHIEVDGGVNTETAVGATAAGADRLAAASAIFNSNDVRSAVQSLRESARKGKAGKRSIR
ncbi:MAG: ribulose-phosphate 3-epimerase [Candidatus Micrarchaeota archaeon]